jgi:hypothetical protein
MRSSTRRFTTAVVGLCVMAGGAAAQQNAPALTFSETSTNTRATAREWEGGGWSSKNSTTVLGADVCWQDVVNSPRSEGRALMTLCENRTLSLAAWQGTFWDSPVTLTADAGATNSKVFALAYEQRSGDLMTVYRKGTDSTIYFRTHTSAIVPEQTLSLGLSSAPQWMELAARPRSDELVLVVRSGGELRAAVWNGSSWGGTVMLDSSTSTDGRPFAVAYMSRTGSAMVVWSATTGAPKYRVWDGAAWGAQAFVPAVSGGVRLGWVSLAANPSLGSDELLAVMSGVNNDINLNNWNGSAWGANLVAETSAATSIERRADIAFQPDAERAIAVWHRAGQNAIRYRIWQGAWSAEAIGPDMGSEAQCLRLAPGYSPDEVVMAVRRRGASTYDEYVAYSSGGTVNLTGIVIGSIASGGAGALPAAPAAAHNSTDVTVANNSTRNLTPGIYRNLEVGNSVTLNFNGAGDYVFRQFKATHNTAVFNFDGGGGTIRIILTNGNWDGMNDFVLNNPGGGPVEVHLNNGNFVGKNNFTASNLSLFVYNGNIDFGNNLSFTGVMYASGNINGSGSVSIPTAGAITVGPGSVSTVVWTGGSAGARSDQGESGPAPSVGTLALAGRPPSAGLRVVRWCEIGLDE